MANVSTIVDLTTDVDDVPSQDVDQAQGMASTLASGDRLDGGASFDGGLGTDSLSLSYEAATSPGVFPDTVYDLTSIDLDRVRNLSISGNTGPGGTTIAKVSSRALANVTKISLSNRAQLTTVDATLDLTGKLISSSAGGTITSSNASGTTFTVDDPQAALLVKGGAGRDKVVLNRRLLTAAQRDQIFAASVESITDITGTYVKLLPADGAVLTEGGEILPQDADQVVQSKAAALTSGTRLNGGAGHDVLALFESGIFDLSALTQFTGFEEVRLTNTTRGGAQLTLRDGVDLTVTVGDGMSAPGEPDLYPYMGQGSTRIYLANSRVTLRGGNGIEDVIVRRSEQLRAGSSFDGGLGSDSLSLAYNYMRSGEYTDTVYDLTSITLSNVERLDVSGNSLSNKTTIVKVSDRALADVDMISLSGNARMTTADATLDLTGKSIRDTEGSVITSSNASGTTFTVDDARSAILIQGGAGRDRVVVRNGTLTADQRELIFTGSVESITDAAGTYRKPGTPAGTVVLTVGWDEIRPWKADLTVAGLAATLNAGTPQYAGDRIAYYSGGDSLDGGGGYDVLALSGSGSFNLAGLARFTGFEEVRLTNTTATVASLTLRDGADLIVTLGDGTTGSANATTGGIAVQLAESRVTLRGGRENDDVSAVEARQLHAGSIIDGGGGSDTLRLSYYLVPESYAYDPKTGGNKYLGRIYVDTIYDLTNVSLTNVERLVVIGAFYGYADTTTIVKVDETVLAGVTTIALSNTARLVTESAVLDLTGKAVTGTSGTFIESRNATGTTFTVDNAAVAALIKGGSGRDKVVVTGQTLTSIERDKIFAAGIETIVDAAGTFEDFTVPADGSTLTTGRDAIPPSDADQTVTATTATLNAGWPTYGPSGSVSYTGGDRLEGGAGYDVLSISGAGTVNLAGLDRFTGFEEVRFTIPASSSGTSSLALRDGADLTVSLSGPAGGSGDAGSVQVILANSRVTINGGDEADTISASAPSRLQAGTVINGGGGRDQLSLQYDRSAKTNSGASLDSIYDLNAIVLRNVEQLSVQGGTSVTQRGMTVVKAGASALAGVEAIDLSYGATLVTADAALDLSGRTISGLYGGGIESTNVLGTTFTTDRAVAAGLFRGGAGRDTVVVVGQTLTTAQRELVFSGSVETIIDAAGTYTKPEKPSGAVTLSKGIDTISLGAGDQVLTATAATLTNGTYTYSSGATKYYNGGDVLDGGAGWDALELLGPGLFDLASLRYFSRFEEVRVVNPTSATASVILRNGGNLLVTLGDGGAAPGETGGITVHLAESRVTLRGGSEADTILAAQGNRLKAGSVIDGGQGIDELQLNVFDTVEIDNASSVSDSYDLTAITLRNVENLVVHGRFGGTAEPAPVVKVDAASLADVRTITLDDGVRFTTSEASLDLTGKAIRGASAGSIEGTRAGGTLFKVDSLAAAALIQGGAGSDTLVVEGLTLTISQRNQFFSHAIDTLVDAAGTYGPNGFVNYNPTLVADAGSTGADGAVTKGVAQGVLANDTDRDGDTLRVTAVGGETAKVGQAVAGSFGTLTLAADGSYRYAATAPVASTNHDRFTYTVADSRGGTAEAVLDITIDPFGPTDDVYLVNGPNDIVTELPGGGNDTVRTSLTRYTLDANVETLVYIGKPTFHGFGNDLDNLILGGRNSDRLEGMGGADTMIGGTGNDTYTVDDARDVIVEQAGEGTDRVLSQVSYTLSDNVEILALTTSANLDGTGNAVDNTIRGNRGRNVLDGRGGADTLIGGEGEDVFVLRAWETEGDVIQDFAGAGAAGGDRLEFRGFGAGAFLTHEAGGDLYTIHAGPALGGMSETFRVAGVTGLDLLSGTASGDVTFAA
ncbi:beta strand repeat-containing protein [Methylobacterium oryzihabitans]|nr:cadherin-like domain-containing protein [Methylobacterium oryzihabitans]